jgi:acyl-CoA synthetase (AMP-forming)/AMP-acid ligase II
MAAYSFLDAEGIETYTRGQIRDLVHARRSDLQAWRSTTPGPHHLLLAPPASVEFVTWFWAAQIEGVPVVPAPELAGRFKARSEQIRSVGRATPVEEVPVSGASVPTSDEHPVTGDAMAVLQFTSGSVKDPKGCVLTHDAVAANMRAATSAFRVGPGQVGVSWCPLYHDMGLFGSVVYPVFSGVHAVLQRPERVILRPVSWLDAIAGHGAAISLAPGFALDLVVRHLRGKPYDKDLSSLEQLIIGSERVLPGTVDAFLRATEPAGLDPSSIHIAWGMAEGTVLCTSRPGGMNVDRSLPEHRDGVASVGWPAPGVEVRVQVDGHAVDDGVVGVVDLRSSGLMSGYCRPDGLVEDPTSSDGWFPTGDAGFLSGGELYLLGRADDVLVVDGRNFFPQDAEALVLEALGAKRPSGVAVVGIARPGRPDAIVAIVETRVPIDEEDRRTVRRACLESLGLRLDEVRSVPHRSLPRTSSGKLMRSRIRAVDAPGASGAPEDEREAAHA